MKDVDSLKKGMEKYITDKEFYFNIKNNVRSSIIKKYNQADFWINLNNEIKKII